MTSDRMITHLHKVSSAATLADPPARLGTAPWPEQPHSILGAALRSARWHHHPSLQMGKPSHRGIRSLPLATMGPGTRRGMTAMSAAHCAMSLGGHALPPGAWGPPGLGLPRSLGMALTGCPWVSAGDLDSCESPQPLAAPDTG